MADPAVLKFFSVPMVHGNAESALREPNSMVITRSLAQKFFPNEDPINKILKGGPFEWIITGVTEDPAPNSTLQFNVLCSIKFIKQQGWDIDQGGKLANSKPSPGCIQERISKRLKAKLMRSQNHFVRWKNN